MLLIILSLLMGSRPHPSCDFGQALAFLSLQFQLPHVFQKKQKKTKNQNQTKKKKKSPKPQKPVMSTLGLERARYSDWLACTKRWGAVAQTCHPSIWESRQIHKLRDTCLCVPAL